MPTLHLLILRLSQLGLLVTYHSLNGVSWSKSTSPLIKKSRLKTNYSAVHTNKLFDQNYRFILNLYLCYNVTLNVLQKCKITYLFDQNVCSLKITYEKSCFTHTINTYFTSNTCTTTKLYNIIFLYG